MVAIGEQKIKKREMNTVKVCGSHYCLYPNKELMMSLKYTIGYNGGCESNIG